MTLILVGFFLVFLDYALGFEASEMVIEILPDPIGYLFVVIGALSLMKEQKKYGILAVLASLMCVFSTYIYYLGLTAVKLEKSIELTHGGIALVGSLIVAYVYYLAVRDSEKSLQSNFNSKGIKDSVFFMIGTTLLGTLFQIVPYMGIIGIILGLTGNVVFLFEIGRTRNAHRAYLEGLNNSTT